MRLARRNVAGSGKQGRTGREVGRVLWQILQTAIHPVSLLRAQGEPPTLPYSLAAGVDHVALCSAAKV